MSFDHNQDGIPLVDIHKRTTKVNLWLVIGIVAFILIGISAAISLFE